MTWQVNGTPDTLTTAGDDMDITDLDARTFNLFLIYSLNTGGTIKHNFRFDDNSNTDYARRRSINDATDSTDTSQPQIEYNGDVAQDRFEIFYSVNISGEEKLQIHFDITQGTAGAGNVPNRTEAVSKEDTTTDSGQYTRIDCFNDGAGSFDTDSNISCLATD